MQVTIRRGLEIPLAGAPRQRVSAGPAIGTVGVLGRDLLSPRPELLVAVGQAVRTGQPVCRDRREPALVAVSPAAGTVTAIHRGDRRRVEAVVIAVGGDEAISCDAVSTKGAARLTRSEVVGRLLASGLWAALRVRPHERVPDPTHVPQSLFVTALDTRPGAPSVAVVLAEEMEAFEHGLRVLARIAPLHLCTEPDWGHAWADLPGVRHSTFAGPHPAGLAGTHIHFLDPITPGREVWHVGAQDVAAMGHLFATGRPWTERVVALCGPLVRNPRLVRTRLGASLEELLDGEIAAGEARVISGSVLEGVAAREPAAFLGRRDQQVSVLAEARHARRRGRPRFSAAGVLSSWRRHGQPLALTTARNGHASTIPSVPAYGRVMPLDLLPIPLLRALAVGDVEAARTLGCLELAEEDLALCTFVCPAKLDYGLLLRRVLDHIREEG